jgi:hypothetical protein
MFYFPALDQLRKENIKTQGFKYTKSSAANIVSGIRQWLFFALYFMIPILPASVDSVVCFMELMSRTSGYQHLKHLLHSVKFLHKALNLPFPEDDFQLDMTMQGLKRKLARVPFQVLPITPKVLRDIFKHLDITKKKDLALWCAFLLSFYALLRKKNVVPSSGHHDPSKVISRRHIRICSEKNMIYLYVGFSKTNQFGARDLVIPIPGNSDPVLDPVRHFQALFTSVQASEDSPAFSFGHNSCVHYDSFTSRLKSLLSKAGYPASSYSGHSFRRGGASFLHACGGTALMVQATGDWSSSCFTRYLFLSTSQRWNSQLLMARGIAASSESSALIC